MKKFLAIAVLALGISFAAAAQPRAIGARLGYGFEASYQHSLGKDFIEANAGLFGFDAANATAIYNFMITNPDWTPREEWGFYAGPGASVGVNFDGGMTIAVAGQVGLEYTVWFPLQISVDLRPQFGLWLNHGDSFYTGGLLGFGPTISARYRF